MQHAPATIEDQLILKAVKEECPWESLPKRLQSTLNSKEEWHRRLVCGRDDFLLLFGFFFFVPNLLIDVFQHDYFFLYGLFLYSRGNNDKNLVIGDIKGHLPCHCFCNHNSELTAGSSLPIHRKSLLNLYWILSLAFQMLDAKLET